MLTLIAAGSIIGGGLLYCLSIWKRGLERTIDALALLAYLISFSVTAYSVMKTLLDDTVFMTQVHEVLLNPAFLVCGAYLGPYGLRLLAGRLFNR